MVKITAKRSKNKHRSVTKVHNTFRGFGLGRLETIAISTYDRKDLISSFCEKFLRIVSHMKTTRKLLKINQHVYGRYFIFYPS